MMKSEGRGGGSEGGREVAGSERRDPDGCAFPSHVTHDKSPLPRGTQ